MCRFFRQAHPHLVLLRFFHANECKIGDGEKQQQHAQLNVGIIGEPPEDVAILVVEVLCGGSIDFDINLIARMFEFAQFALQILFILL